MISANEAKKQKEELNSLQEKQQLETVEANIKKDIKQGYTYYYGKLLPTIEAELKSLGYKVEFYSDQREGSITTIRW
jgi:hypothetical protein